MARLTMAMSKSVANEDSKSKFWKTALDYLNHYQTEVGSNKGKAEGLSFDASIPLSEKHDRILNAFSAYVKEETGIDLLEKEGMSLRAKLNSPQVKWAVFAIRDQLIDMILPDALIAQGGIYSEYSFGDYGDSFSFEKKSNDLYAVYKNSNDRKHVELQKDYTTTVTLVPEEYAVTVQTNLYKVMTGVETLGSFVTKAAYSIETEITYQAYEAMNTAFAALSAVGDTQLKYTGFSETNLVKLCQTVQAWNQGAMPVIAGTKAALGQVLPSTTGIQIQIDTPYVTQGYINVYKGYQLIELYQRADYTKPFTLKLNDLALYVISPSSDKPVKVVVEGGTQTRTDDVYANADLSQSTTICKRWKVGVITNSIGGLMVLT